MVKDRCLFLYSQRQTGEKLRSLTIALKGYNEMIEDILLQHKSRICEIETVDAQNREQIYVGKLKMLMLKI